MPKSPEVEFAHPDISRWREGNTGVPYVMSFEAARPGPHVMINAVTHGNEICGAIAVAMLLERGIRPTHGKLTFAFVNYMAYTQFDPAHPRATRCVEEDINRVWVEAILDGPGSSVELKRARELRAIYDTVDLLLDLHSMSSASPALMLCAGLDKERAFAQRMGYPELVVCGSGHVRGRRLIEYTPFNDAANAKVAVLVECGSHWEKPTDQVAIDAAVHFLEAAGTVAAADLAGLAAQPRQKVKLLEVSYGHTAKTDAFRFVADYPGGHEFGAAGTVFAHDGEEPVATPHERAVLIMPNYRPRRGDRCLRLARWVA